MSRLDVAIVGGGPVGSALAAWLGGRGLAVGVFESREAPSTDGRTLALSSATRESLERVQAWPADATDIQSIHVSQRNGPGRTVIDAHDMGLAALGATVRFGALEAALHGALQRFDIPVHRGWTCEGIALAEDAARVTFAGRGSVEARLLVLADGGANASRIPGIAFQEKDYGQVAVVGLLATDRPHAGRAYERFTSEGPMALLPVGARMALVWTATPAEAQRLLALDEASFLRELQARFGDRAGRFTAIENRASFALRLRSVNVPTALRTAIIGNAAQALHPIAGQGLNLGLRDAAELADVVAAVAREEIGCAGMLDAYRRARRRDTGRGIAFTDLLVSTFASRSALVSLGRGAALAAFDLFPPARRMLARRMIHGASAR
jgi:2-octaprenyl-6-methoxyphenol hydroxylase